MASSTKIPPACPVVGTTNTVLPPSHPDIDLSRPGQTCPVVGATTDHHHNLHRHPPVAIPHPEGGDGGTSVGADDAAACPALRRVVDEPRSRAMDDKVCPVVGAVTTVLPPGHPPTGNNDNAVCPVTKARVDHHRGRVVGHPDVAAAKEGAVCPVVGARA